MLEFLVALCFVLLLVCLTLLVGLRRRIDELTQQFAFRPLTKEPPFAAPEPVAEPLRATAVPAMTAVTASPQPLCAPPPLPPLATPPPPPAASQPDVEGPARQLLRRAWNWFVVGEEFRRPDVSAEFAIASNWLMRVGVIIGVVAVGFGLQLSIQRGMLGPQGRVALSLVGGAAGVVWGLHLLGRRYHLIGQGLIGGGLAMMYFAIYAASVLFALWGRLPAFGLMALVSVAAVVLAVRHHSLAVAVLGVTGGYLTPLMLRSQTPSLALLFGYLLLLAAVASGVAWRKQWPLLTWLSFLFHHALCGLALAKIYTPDQFAVAMLFLGAFFVLFSTAIFLYAVRHRQRATLLELIALFLNAGLFLALGFDPIRDAAGRMAVAWLTVGVAAFYIAHVYTFFLRGLRDRALLAAFLGLAALFLGITMPLLTSDAWLTVTWAVQAAVMLTLASRLESPFLRRLAEALYLLVICRFWIDLVDTSFAPDHAAGRGAYLAALGQRVLAFGMPILSFAVAWRLLRRPPAAADGDQPPAAPRRPLALTAAFALYAALFIYLNREAYALAGVLHLSLRQLLLSVVWVAFGLYLLQRRRHVSAGLFHALLLLLVAALAFKLFFFETLYWRPDLSRLIYRHAGAHAAALGVRLLSALAGLGCLATIFSTLRRDAPACSRRLAAAAGYLTLAALLAYLTFETGTLLNAFQPAFRGGGISLLWGGYAFGLVLGGLRYGARPLRLLGLALFAVTIGKVFFVDLEGLDVLYRLLAFAVLGVVLLLAAFVYLKHQRLFTERS